MAVRSRFRCLKNRSGWGDIRGSASKSARLPKGRKCVSESRRHSCIRLYHYLLLVLSFIRRHLGHTGVGYMPGVNDTQVTDTPSHSHFVFRLNPGTPGTTPCPWCSCGIYMQIYGQQRRRKASWWHEMVRYGTRVRSGPGENAGLSPDTPAFRSLELVLQLPLHRPVYPFSRLPHPLLCQPTHMMCNQRTSSDLPMKPSETPRTTA
jgi:hypothetical protein